MSGDGAVAGLSVQVVPMYPEDECVAANGTDQVRLIAVVLGVDGDFIAAGTMVTWSAGAGFLAAASSDTGYAEIIGEEQRADDYYHHVTLDLPAAAVIGVYAYSDIRRKPEPVPDPPWQCVQACHHIFESAGFFRPGPLDRLRSPWRDQHLDCRAAFQVTL